MTILISTEIKFLSSNILSRSWSVVILFSILLVFVLGSVYLPKFLTLAILFPTAVGAMVVALLAVLGILFSTWFILALEW